MRQTIYLVRPIIKVVIEALILIQLGRVRNRRVNTSKLDKIQSEKGT